MKSTNNREDLYVLVTSITLDGATVSGSGDEWKQGDVPVLGREGFILFFFVAGIGGAVGLFIYSTGMVKRSASKTMKTLIGDEGMKKAASVKADAKAAKEAGMESPERRKSRVDKNRAKQAPKKEKSPPKEAKKKKDENPMGGFDLGERSRFRLHLLGTGWKCSERPEKFGGCHRSCSEHGPHQRNRSFVRTLIVLTAPRISTTNLECRWQPTCPRGSKEETPRATTQSSQEGATQR